MSSPLWVHSHTPPGQVRLAEHNTAAARWRAELSVSVTLTGAEDQVVR